MEPLRPEALTWTALLAQWMDFARASVALPPDADGDAWRSAVPAIITLQAVTFALGDLAGLSRDEHALACDKADILIRESRRKIEAAWVGSDVPGLVREIEADASLALQAVAFSG